MKKVLRTKLQYTCNKYESFCNIDRVYKMVYDRSYDLIVTASTEKECWDIMDSFEEYMRKKGIQDTFDSNLEPSLNEKNNLWVGIVEVYINNDDIAEQKEIIKDAYKEWKENLKTSSANSEEKKEESKTIEEVQEVVEEKEYNKMSNRVDFKNKIELSMGEKVDLNVKLKRGQIEKVFIDEELKREIYNHYIAISDKKKKYIGLSFFECKRRGQVISIELGKECIEIVPTFHMLSVKVTDKRGNEKIYYLNVEPKKEEPKAVKEVQESKTVEEVQEVIEEKECNKMSVEFKPQNTAINIGNSYSAKVLISEVNTDEKILDYGCGSGRNIKYIIECLKENKPSVRVDGCDIVEQLEKEKESHNKLREKGCIIVESNLLEKNKYDKILNSHVLNVIESDEIKNIVIKDIYNKLKKGGKAYFEVRTKADVEGTKTKEKYGDGWKIKKGKYFTYQEVISKEKMEKMLVENGFKVVQHICNSSKHFVVVSK